MTRSNRQKRTVLLWMLGLVFLGAGVSSAAQPAAGDPLQFVPAESLFCIKINNLNATLGQVDQFLTGISPFGLSMLVQSQFAQVLGSPEPNAVNMSGSFAVFGPLPGGDSPNPGRVGILVPVSDYQKFAKSNPNVTPPDAQGISSIGPEGQQMLAAANVGGYALVTAAANRQALVEVKTWIPQGATSLAQRLGAEEAKRAQGSPVWVYANIQTVQKMFGPMIQAGIQKVQEGFKQMQGQPMMGQAGAMAETLPTLLNRLLQETQSVSLSLNPQPNALHAGFAMNTVAGTEMAKFFTGTPAAPDKTFLRYLDNGAAMNIVTAIDPASLNRLNNFYFDLMAKMAGKDPSSEEVLKLKKLATDATNSLGGSLAASLTINAKSKPPFELKYVAAIKDPQTFYRVLEEWPKVLNSGLIADLNKESGIKFGFELKRKAETYKDVPIDTIKITMEPTDPNSQASQTITAMYGQGMNAQLAIVNNLLVYGIAQDPAPIVRKLIDQVKAGNAAQAAPSEVQSAMQMIPGAEKSECFMTLNLLRMMQMATAMMPLPAAQQPVKSQSSLAFAGSANNGRLSVEIGIPKQHLIEIMSFGMQMGIQKQQQQPQGQQGQM